MVFSLRTELAGVELKNPVFVAAGAHSRSGKVIKEVSEFGPSAFCTKTITVSPNPDPLPCFVTVKGGFINAVLGSELPAEQWFNSEIEIAKQGKAKVIANLKGRTPE